MEDFKYRTEDILLEEILGLFVSTTEDRQTIDMLKSPSPIILEGSRGTGKSFLMRVAEIELGHNFEAERVLPVYVSFVKSSLIHTSDPNQFVNWMLSRLCTQIIRSLRRRGLILPASSALSLLGGGSVDPAGKGALQIERIAEAYEESFRAPGALVNNLEIPDVQDFKDAIEDICREREISRICILFDEAVHIFRPEQQRQFFTLFRDLRSPYISCNAAVYPGVTSYGSTFELTHDATLRKVERDILRPDYLETMKEIVVKQASADTIAAISRNGNNFKVLAFSVNGNPRFLLKTISKCPKMNTKEVNEAIKSFYRTEIWAEHTGLGDKYMGHRSLIDWGRDFIEKTVVPETKKKNDTRQQEGRTESTCYFWIHRDAPEAAKESIRLLSYIGIVQKIDEGIRGTRAGLGTRFALNLGCLLAPEANPINYGAEIIKNLSIKRFTEFGANHPEFVRLGESMPDVKELSMIEVITSQLSKSIDIIDITNWQLERLKEIGLATIGDILTTDEQEIINEIHLVGPVRARRIKNAANAAVLEYLSG